MTTARDLKSPSLHTVSPSTTIVEAAQLLRDRRVGALPVVGEDGTLVGIVTDRDLVVFAIAAGAAPTDTIEEYGIREVTTVDVDTDIAEVQRVLAERRVHRLPVVEEGRLVGVISLADIARSEDVPKEQVGTTTASILLPD
jgi:CBS domain-containing protein